MNEKHHPHFTTEPDRRSIKRRTIVANTVWTLPAISIASAAPAAAASPNDPVVTFNQPSYAASGCGDLTGVVVTVLADGTNPPPAGTPVTVTLPAGFTFSDGSTSRTLTTEPDGTATVPAITAPASAENAALTAESLGQTATAALQVTPAGGSVLYTGNRSFQPTHFLPVVTTGLPSGEQFQTVYATDGAVYATMTDGKIYTLRENPTTGTVPGTARIWHDTGMTGNVHDMIISSSVGAGNSLVLNGGQLTSFVSNSTSTTAPVPASLPNPPGTPVDIATSNGVGTYYVETSDGRLWSTPFSGSQRGTWTEITGFPTPLTDWTLTEGNNSEQVTVIGADGNLYSLASGTGLRPYELRDYRASNATWTGPLVKFANPHTGHSRSSMTGGILFVDSSGGLYSLGAQNRNIAGVLQGQLADKELLVTPDSIGRKTAWQVHVVDGGKLYVADYLSGSGFAFRDVTPPESLLNGATIVDVHQTGSGIGQSAFAIASDGRIFLSTRIWNATMDPGWVLATGLPEEPNAEPIIQDGKFTYVLGTSSECPA